jgi:hypothetical protein
MTLPDASLPGLSQAAGQASSLDGQRRHLAASRIRLGLCSSRRPEAL